MITQTYSYETIEYMLRKNGLSVAGGFNVKCKDRYSDGGIHDVVCNGDKYFRMELGWCPPANSPLNIALADYDYWRCRLSVLDLILESKPRSAMPNEHFKNVWCYQNFNGIRTCLLPKILRELVEEKLLTDYHPKYRRDASEKVLLAHREVAERKFESAIMLLQHHYAESRANVANQRLANLNWAAPTTTTTTMPPPGRLDSHAPAFGGA